MANKPQKNGISTRKGGEIVQERALQTREMLVRAASTVFWGKGYHQTQAPDIADAAGVSVGTLYRYFGGKRDILIEIARQELEQAHQEILSMLTPDRFAGKGRQKAIAALLHILIAAITRHPERHKLFLEISLRDDELASIKRSYDDRVREILTQVITAVCSKEVVSDPAATAYMLHTALVECALYLAGIRGTQAISRERGMAALSEIVSHALFGLEE